MSLFARLCFRSLVIFFRREDRLIIPWPTPSFSFVVAVALILLLDVWFVNACFVGGVSLSRKAIVSRSYIVVPRSFREFIYGVLSSSIQFRETQRRKVVSWRRWKARLEEADCSLIYPGDCVLS